MEQGILDVIAMLSSQRATGRLQITTGMTEGALFFDRGQLVNAWLGKLAGFQAINALASVRDASYDFDPTISLPPQSSITANERVLLKDFFGIATLDPESSPPHDADVIWSEHNSPPAQVVPLATIEDQDDDEATLVRRNPSLTSPPPPPEPSARSTFAPVLLLLVLAALVSVAAIVLINRARQPVSTTAAVAPAVQTASPAGGPTEPQPETAAVPDLSGNWKVVNTVEQTSYDAYKNMEIGFNVSIDQAGKEFTGRGEKISENGQSLPAAGRTPIVVKGTIDGDKVEATFSESGARRNTSGRFAWRIDRASGGLTGRFVSSAARTRGRSAATKNSN